jgi:hypothetical protein
MRAFLLAVLFAVATPVPAQDALQLVLQATPGAVALAGSPENLSSLVAGFTSGAPVRLATAGGPPGFRRVVTFAPPVRLTPAQAVAFFEQVVRDYELAGIARPSAEQLAASLGARGVRSFLEADPRQPTPDEQALARLPRDVQAAVVGLPPREALRTVELADQQLIALGTPYASGDRRSEMVLRVRLGTGYVAASAGATTFPPLSPLVAAPLWQP